jgi:tetratricopeptide (TPR) repeat protein
MPYLALFAFALMPPDYDRAVALIEKGQPAAAVSLLEAAMKSDPGNAQYAKALGVAYASLGDYRAAAPQFEKACRAAPPLPDACYFAGRARYAADQYRDAIPLLEKDLPRARAHAAVGQCLEALGEYKEAEARFRLAIARREPPGEAQLAYGKFLTRQGRPGQAMPLLEQAQVLRTINARFELALALVQAERPGEAISHLEAIVAARPDHEASVGLLQRARRLAGRGPGGAKQ